MIKRVKNYNNFLLESVRSLLESIMTGSQDLLQVLYKAKGRDNLASSEIAEILFIMLRGDKDFKTNFNLLGISDKNDEVTFLPDTQYQKLVDDNIDTKDKTRSKTKVGRMMRQLLNDNGYEFSDKEIEQFVNNFKSSWDSFKGVDRVIKVVEGDEILHWYNVANYASGSGTLGNSCMRMPEKNGFMKLYADNENCELVILTNGQGLLARSLLWKVESDESNFKYFLDRIYVIKDSDQEFISNWVLDNVVDGRKQDLGNYRSNDGNRIKMKVNLNKVNFEEYPYIDTLFYLYKNVGENGKLTGGGFLANYMDSVAYKDHIVYQLLNTDGTYDELSHRYSNKEGRFIPTDDACYINSIEDWVSKSTCYYSNLGLHWIPKDEAIWSETQEDWIPKSESVNHKEYGIVWKNSLVDVIMEYKGTSDDPFKIATELGGARTDLFKIEQTLNVGDDVFKSDYTPNGDYRWFSTELMASDGSNRFFPDFLSFKLYEVVDDRDVPETFVIKEAGFYYILESAAKVFDVEIDKTNYTNVYFYNVKMSADVYRGIDKLDKSDTNVTEYSKIITYIHNYFMNTKAIYKREYYNTVVIDAIKGDKYEFIINLGNETFESYLKDNKDYVYKELDDYYIFDNPEKALNLLRLFSIIYIVSKDEHDAANNLEYYLNRVGKSEGGRTYRELKYMFEESMRVDFMLVFEDKFNKAIDKLDTSSKIGSGDIDSSEFRDYIIKELKRSNYSDLFDKLTY